MRFIGLSRREVLKAAAVAGIACGFRKACADDKAPAGPGGGGRVFYYVDGYHGGVDGHMPADSLRNVLDGLEKFPHWKVSFEIEPYSWAVFAKSDPASIEKLTHFLADATPAGRVEIVSGAYAQAYMWNASGESNIRQIAFGLAELRSAFAGIVVDTYAVQEPCWTSCLPQLLKSFGYKRAVLKNSTCWGGYHAPTLDADLIHWVAPDGTALPAVPRYAMEKMVGPATSESAQPTTGFIDQCIAAGIEHPAGTILQDMGWPGRPWRLGMNEEVTAAMKHVTWRQYTETIASPPTKQWKASQEDLRVGLPWGGSILQRIAQVVRLSENQLVQTEKLASMARVRRGKAFDGDALKEAWKLLLWSQHHDVWIVSYNRHHDGTWASAVDAKRESIDSDCKRISNEAAESMTAKREGNDKAGRFVRVFNTSGFARRDLAVVEMPEGNAAIRVLDEKGEEVPCQQTNDAGRPGGLLFPADVAAMGYATYELADAKPAGAKAKVGAARAIAKGDGTVIIETDLYAISIDTAKGGRISSLFAKEQNREFVDDASPRGFNEFRGYFPTEGKWFSSVEAPATFRIVEEGPLRVTAEIHGKIGPWPFVTVLSVVAGQRRIDLKTTFDFPPDAGPFGGDRRADGGSKKPPFRLGEDWEAGRDTMRSNRRPFYDSSFKLQALFPAKLQRPTLDKNAPFDVCRSKIPDTRFNAWDSIKHNLITNWVDLLDEKGDAGLAVMIDHVTAYSLSPGEPLGIVMGYAGRGIWHDYRLGRTPTVSYALVPHAGDWAKAQLWQELSRWSEPLVSQPFAGPSQDDKAWTLLDASNTGIDVTTIAEEGGRLMIRLFNAEGDGTPKRLTLDRRVRRVQQVELDGRVIAELPLKTTAAGGREVMVTMKRFAVATLRCDVE